MKCNICESNSEKIFTKTILAKYAVAYYRCPTCYFIQTEPPYWLDEAYNSAINFSDIGLLHRNQVFSEKIVALFRLWGLKGTSRYLDYGGGYGIFVRMMRDNGYNFYWEDEYCENLYAKLFQITQAANTTEPFEVITAFEVFEHLAQPMKEIERLLTRTDTIIFSTELTSTVKESIQNWWYIGENHGQHISLFHRETLEYISTKLGLNLFSGKGLHVLSRKGFSPFFFKLAINYPFARLQNTVFPPNSLLNDDFQLYLNKSKQ